MTFSAVTVRTCPVSTKTDLVNFAICLDGNGVHRIQFQEKVTESIQFPLGIDLVLKSGPGVAHFHQYRLRNSPVCAIMFVKHHFHRHRRGGCNSLLLYGAQGSWTAHFLGCRGSVTVSKA